MSHDRCFLDGCVDHILSLNRSNIEVQSGTFSAFLQNFEQGFILVSHDRCFLDGCVDHILSLNRSNIEVQSGTFSAFLQNFEQQQRLEEAQNESLKKDIRRLSQSAKRTQDWSDRVEASKTGAADKGYIGHKSAKMMKRAKSIEARQQKAIEQKSTQDWSDRVEASKTGAADKGYIGHKSAKMMKRAKSIEARQQKAIEQKSGLLKNQERVEALKLLPLQYRSDTLVTFLDAAVCYGGNPVSGPVSFSVHRGERVVLDGSNGSGKSSLLKFVVGEVLEHTGTITMGSGLVISYVPQDTSHLQGTLGSNGSGKSSLLKFVVGEVLEHTGTITMGSGLVISYVPQDTSHLQGTLSDFAKKNQIEEALFKAILRKLDFERIQFEKEMQDFSGGQKKKVLIAKSLCEQAHLYVWDEPLNFVDLYSRMQIEQDFSGGQKKKVLIAKSLCEQAHLYVWDEPLNFVDLYSRMQIEQLIREFSPTMLLVEHDQAFREAVATKTVQIEGAENKNMRYF